MQETRVTELEAFARAEALGAGDGTAAGSWVVDGNTTAETAIALLVGLEVGDPEIWDAIPSPDLSGQWADGMTPARLVLECTGLELEDYYATTPEDADWFSQELCERYEHGFSNAVEDAVAESARGVLGTPVIFRATFDAYQWEDCSDPECTTPGCVNEDPTERGGWVNPSNPWGSFEQDREDDSAEPESETFPNLWDAALFALEFPGGIWDYSESESEQDYTTGEWKRVTLHCDDDSQAELFAVIDAIREAGIKSIRAVLDVLPVGVLVLAPLVGVYLREQWEGRNR